MFFLLRIIAAAFALGTLAACGQKGPLFLAPQSLPYSVFPSKTVDGALAAPALPVPPASVAK